LGARIPSVARRCEKVAPTITTHRFRLWASDAQSNRGHARFLYFRVAELYCGTKTIGDRIMQCVSAMPASQRTIRTRAAQVAALKAAKCDQIFREKASGGRWDRPELHRLLDRLRQGDVLVVWKLDRLSRSLRDVLMLMERLGELKAGFRSLTEAIDTTTPAGRMMMQMVGAFAEFERAMLRQRTKAGIATARSEGRVGGRKPKLTAQQQSEIVKMVWREERTVIQNTRIDL
jgi:DNA invertase Pin-like site-specific DNA recombinase